MVILSVLKLINMELPQKRYDVEDGAKFKMAIMVSLFENYKELL